MANRTTVPLVCSVLDTDVDIEIVKVFIESANVMVTQYLGTSVLATAVLKQIETYWAAHLVAVHRDRQAASEAADGVTVKYQGTTGEGLRATHWGQTAIEFDKTGTLASIGDDDRIAWVARAGSEISNPRITA